MSLNIATLLAEAAARNPSGLALRSDEEDVRYDVLWRRVRRLAFAFRELGLAPGQNVALLLPNAPSFTLAYFAAHVCGCPVVPLNIMLKADELAYHLQDSDAVALVTCAELQGEALAAAERCAALRHVIVHGVGPDAASRRTLRLEALLEPDELLDEAHATSADDTAVILYTSGTTGRPKGAELSHFNLLYNAEFVVRQWRSLSTQDMRSLLALPLFHSFGQTALQNATLMAAGTVTLMRRFDPLVAARLIARDGVNVFAGVPTMYYGLLHHEGIEPAMLASLELCFSGGASMPEDVMRRFDETFGVDLIEAYGLSETSPFASCNPLGGGKRVGSVGRPIWGVAFRLVGEDGRVLDEDGIPGELCIKGHNVMKGYYRRPEATTEALSDGWFRTGDIAMREADGFYRLVDRKKDMIIRGGFNVYPREVEEHLYAHPAVVEAAVVGVPDERYGEEIHGFVALRAGSACSPDELVAYCRERLAAYKYPRHVTVLEALPKGPTGKILKRVLREQAAPARGSGHTR
jgi:long-chain acyl-CoA synthetase